MGVIAYRSFISCDAMSDPLTLTAVEIATLVLRRSCILELVIWPFNRLSFLIPC